MFRVLMNKFHYNSAIETVTNIKDDDEYYFRNGVENFNRIYFKYQTEWKTSDIGEKIIRICKMTDHRRSDLIQFYLYISKYRQDAFFDIGLYLLIARCYGIQK